MQAINNNHDVQSIHASDTDWNYINQNKFENINFLFVYLVFGW